MVGFAACNDAYGVYCPTTLNRAVSFGFDTVADMLTMFPSNLQVV